MRLLLRGAAKLHFTDDSRTGSREEKRISGVRRNHMYIYMVDTAGQVGR